MPLQPSESVRFDSWKQLLSWLPQATEGQLVTVFVWAADQQNVPADHLRRLSQVRKEAFERLVDRTREPLKRYLARRLGCRDAFLCEDVVQEVLIQLFRRAEQFDPERSFWGWLYRIARNKYIDSLRRQRPGDIGIGSASGGDVGLEQWIEKMSLTGPTPETAALAQERRQRLNLALDRLPGMQQTIVKLKLEGVKGTEIAQRVSRSQAYVSQTFHEALEELREVLED